MFQESLFTNAFKDQKFLGSGCFASVCALGDTGWVVKTNTWRDGTLNYLEWCLRLQECGEALPGMPEIDFLVHTELGYIVTMRQYTPLSESARCYDVEDENILELANAFAVYMMDTYCTSHYANDVHPGNVLKDSNGNMVLTDPSSKPYQTHPRSDNFVLKGDRYDH